jgi:hypothetical protein
LTSSPTEQSSKKSFEEKAQDRSIGVGTKHAMILLGELHKNESLSNSWDWKRACRSDASSEAMPPIFQEQAVPSCPKPSMWSNLEEITKDPPHHHDEFPTRASPGKTANGQDGCRHQDNPSNACPGEASNGKGTSNHCVGGHHDNPPNASLGKASNGRRLSDHACNGTPSRRTPKRLKASTPPGNKIRFRLETKIRFHPRNPTHQEGYSNQWRWSLTHRQESGPRI